MINAIIIIYLSYGFFSYWPLIFAYSPEERGEWYEWLAVWAIWTVFWPWPYICDIWHAVRGR